MGTGSARHDVGAPTGSGQIGMYVCLCEAVSSRTIAAAIAAGAASVSEVAQSTGAGTSCAKCRATIWSLVQHHRHGRVQSPGNSERSDQEGYA
jgi:bacterioferritin-associated ferredoxin